MSDRLPPSSSAIKQIYALAEARWRYWDKRRGRRGGSPSGSETRPGLSAAEGRGGTRPGSRSATTTWLDRRPRRPVTEAERRKATRLRVEGHSLRVISLRINRPMSTVRRMLGPTTSQADGPASLAEFQALDDRMGRIESCLSTLSQALLHLEIGRAPKPRNKQPQTPLRARRQLS